MRAAAAALTLLLAALAVAGVARADNALTLTVPKVVAGRLGALLADKTYAKAELSVRQGCRRPGDKEVTFAPAAANVPLAPFDAPEKDYAVALPDCARDARVESVEVRVRLTSPKGEVAEFSCGADSNVVAHSASGCCGQRLSYRFASCLAADLPRLERSTYEFSFNGTSPAFKGVCKEGQVRVQQYCSPGGATTGEWTKLSCDKSHYELTAPVCVQASGEGAVPNTVTEYSLEYKPKAAAEVQTCFGRSTLGLPDPASVLNAFAGNRRVYITRAGISSCEGEADARVADTPEDQRKKQERESNKESGGGKATNSSMDDGGSAGKALEAYSTCEALRQKDPSAASGVYILTDAEGINFRAYCEMKLGGGGWMLAFKQSKFGSGSVLDSDKALGSTDLLNVDFAGSAAVSKSALQYGEPAELLFVSGADTANNWFTTAALGAYQNWTDSSRLCAYRPKMLKQFRVSHTWDSKKTSIWSDTNVQMTTKADARASALHIGRYVKNEAGDQCVGGTCSTDRHGRMKVDGVCTKGAAGVGDWLVFTRPKQKSADANKYPLDPVLDRIAGEFISPVHRYRGGVSYHGNWGFETMAPWVGDLNGDGLDDFARPGATELRLFISKGNGEFYEPVYPFRNGWNFGWNPASWTTLKAMDLDGDGRMDIVRASSNTLHGIIPNSAKADAEAKCWHVAPGTKIPDDCFKKTGWRVPNGWNFAGAWSFASDATLVGDFNSDGKDDIARLGAQYIHFFISKGDGSFFTPVYRFEAGTEFGFNEHVWTSFKAADVDGDGTVDVVRSSGRTAVTFFSRGTNETCWRRGGVVSYSCMEEVQNTYPHRWNFAGWWWTWKSSHKIQGDFNGDGKMDFARVGGTYTHFFISKGDGYYDSPVYYYPHRWNFGHSNYWCQTFPAGDYDGDGRDDFVKSCGRTVYFFMSRGSPDDGRCWQSAGAMRSKCFKTVVRHYPYGWAFYHWWNFDHRAVGYGDFNGDGKQDWMNLRHPHYAHTFISKDKESVGLDEPATGQYVSHVSKHRQVMSGADWGMESWGLLIGDFNGDGRDDAVRLGRHSMRFFIAKAKPDGDQMFFQPEYKYPAGWDFTNNEHHWSSLKATDMNGDKRADIVRTSARYNHVFLSTKGGARCFERDDQMPDDCFGRTVYHYPKGWGFSGHWTWHSWDTIQGDFDGDGLEDYARLGATYAHFFISKGDGSYYHPVLHYPHRWNFGWNRYYWTTLQPADHDGDGRTDFIRTSFRGHHGFYPRGGKECWHHNGNINVEKCMRTTGVTYPWGWHFSGAWHWSYGTTLVGDYNGDGKADIAKLGGPYIHFFISKGDGSFYTPIYHFPSYWHFWWYNWPWVTLGGGDSRPLHNRFTDMDGDGRSDIIRTYVHYQHGFFPRGSNEECWHRDDTPPSYRPMHCMRITTYWYPHNWHFNGGMAFTGVATRPMDVNGDGRMDFVNWRHSHHAHVFLSKAPNDTETRDAEHPLLGKLDTPVSYYNHGWYFYWHWWMRSTMTVTADLNGDGRTDYVRFGHTYMHLFISKGDGTFYQPIYAYPNNRNFGWNTWWWRDLKARDVNGDKRDDLIRAHPQLLATFMPSGTNKACWHRDTWIPQSCFRVVMETTKQQHWGHWHWTSSRATQGDYNGDGMYDLCFTGDTHSRYYISRGDGTYYQPVVYHGGDNYGWHQGAWYTAGSQDADSDGQDDVLRLHPRHAFTVFSRGGDECWKRDGRVSDACLHRTVYTFPHGWNFVYWHVWRWYSHATVLGDFNGDGKMDFARLGSSYSHMFISKGDGQYYSPILAMPRRYHFSWSEYWHSTLLNHDGKGNDLDGDGRTDFARIHARGVYQFYMRGDNEKCWHRNDNWPQHRGPECYTLKHFTFPHRWSFSGWWWNFASSQRVGDFNGDGKTDFMNIVHPRYAHMFLTKPEDHTPEVRPAGEFLGSFYHYPVNRRATGNWHFQESVVYGDFNGDGREDIARMGDTEMRLFISRGNGTFYTPVYKYQHGIHFGWNENTYKPLRALDVNGDARKDIVRMGPSHGYVLISEGTNAECWHKNTEIPVGCFRTTTVSYKNSWRFDGSWNWNSKAIVVGDFNGDGREDFARLGGTEVRMFISKGDGQFYQPLYPFPRGWNFGTNEWYWTTLPAADFDGDGRADFIRTYHTYNHGFFPRGTNEACWHKDGPISTGCMRITAHGYGRNHNGAYHGFNTRRAHVNDYNGDGLADYALVQGHVIFFYISKGDGHFWQPIYRFNHGWNFGYNEGYWTTLPTGDYDGDGRGDFIRSYYTYTHGFFPRGSDERCWHHNDHEPNYRPNDCMQTTTYLYPGRWHFSGGWGFWRNSAFALDLNGDARTDYINMAGSTYNHVFIAEGDEEE